MFITLYEVKRYERMSGAQGLMIILFNILHLAKLISDKLLLFQFRIWYIRYNLQAETLDDYWHITDLKSNQSVDKEYLMRAAGSWIFIDYSRWSRWPNQLKHPFNLCLSAVKIPHWLFTLTFLTEEELTV
jgi:hypothetical protein